MAGMSDERAEYLRGLWALMEGCTSQPTNSGASWPAPRPPRSGINVVAFHRALADAAREDEEPES